MKRLPLRILSLTLMAALLLPLLFGCGYRPVKSTKWESTPVFSFGEYTVNTETLHAFFMSKCNDIPGFSASYFSGSNGNERFATVLASAVQEIAGIYAMFAVCSSVGIDPFTEEIDDEITEYVKTSVEGGQLGDHVIRGFESYDDYLEYIRANYYMNDAVNRLMIRYALCEEKLDAYYKTSYRYSEADVTAFFESDDCIRITWVNRQGNSAGLGLADNLDLLTRARDYLAAGNYDMAIQYSLSEMTDFYMGRYTLDPLYYGELIAAAYDLEVGEVSSIMDLGSLGYFAFRKRIKDSADLSAHYEQIVALYLGDAMYGKIEEKQNALLSSISYTEYYHSLTPTEIMTAK